MGAAKKMVCGIPAEFVKEGAVDAALARLDISPSKEKSSLEGKVSLLKEAFEKLPNNKLADCDVCGAASDFTLDCCPFCGHGDDEPRAEAEAAEPPDEAQEDELRENADEEDAESAATEEHEQETAAKEEMDDAQAEAFMAGIDQGVVIDPANLPKAEESPTPAPLVDAKKARAERKRVSKAKPLPAQNAAGAAVTSLAVVPPAPVAKREGAARLDAAVEEIKSLDRGFGAASWLVAQRVAKLDEEQLWKLRVDEKGAPVYRNFEAFALKELRMTREYASAMRKIYVRFTKDQFEQLGPTRLRLIIQAPEDEQEELLERAKKNETPVGELAKEVKEKRKKAGMKPSGGKRKPREESGKITVASVLGKQTVAILQKPAKKGDKPEPVVVKAALAKALEGAYGYFDLGNDTRVWLSFKVRDNGALVLQRDIRRLEE